MKLEEARKTAKKNKEELRQLGQLTALFNGYHHQGIIDRQGNLVNRNAEMQNESAMIDEEGVS